MGGGLTSAGVSVRSHLMAVGAEEAGLGRFYAGYTRKMGWQSSA